MNVEGTTLWAIQGLMVKGGKERKGKTGQREGYSVRGNGKGKGGSKKGKNDTRGREILVSVWSAAGKGDVKKRKERKLWIHS